MTGIYDSRGEEYTLAELRVVLREHGLRVIKLDHTEMPVCTGSAVSVTEERCDGAIVVTTFEGKP